MNKLTKDLTAADVVTTMGRYKEREKQATTLVWANADRLARQISAILQAADITKVAFSSGFRPPAANAAAGGAARSAHMTGEACDLIDLGAVIGQKLAKQPELLAKFDLYLEDPAATPGWCHLQTRPTRSGRRVFKP